MLRYYTMFALFRKYASVVVLTLMSLFVVVLAIDESADRNRILADLTFETCVEWETADIEWDEDGADNGDGQLQPTVFSAINAPSYLIAEENLSLCSTSLQSEKQRLGQVRRYAPLNANRSSYYV